MPKRSVPFAFVAAAVICMGFTAATIASSPPPSLEKATSAPVKPHGVVPDEQSTAEHIANLEKAVAALTNRVNNLEAGNSYLSKQIAKEQTAREAVQAELTATKATIAQQADVLKKAQNHRHCVPGIGGFQMVMTSPTLKTKALITAKSSGEGLRVTSPPMDGSVSNC